MPKPGEPALFYAVSWCPLCRRVRAFLEATGTPYREIDPQANPEAAAELARLSSGGAGSVPSLKVGERLLVNPSDAELSEVLGVPIPPDLDIYDAAIVGGGPAGLTAAIYCARENLRTLVIEKGLPGGQAAVTARIENYPGFPEPVSGMDLMERVHRQALLFGAEVLTGETVTAIRNPSGLFEIETDRGVHRACGVIVASGAVYRRLNVPGEEKLTGHGVSFCATCDAPFFKGREIVVVGGGNSALQETIHLADFAARITIVENLDHLTGSKILESRVRSLPFVEILLSSEVTEVLGAKAVEGVRVRSRETGEEKTIPCSGVFVFIGQTPLSEFLRGFVELDPQGFVIADSETLQTSVQGLFAAGDVRSGSSKQITAAVGEGTVASFMVRKCLVKKRNGTS
jgi:thioredoxin reductase (NADPH)